MDSFPVVVPHEDFLTVFDESCKSISTLCVFCVLWVVHAAVGWFTPCNTPAQPAARLEPFLPTWRQNAWRRVFSVHPSENFTAPQQLAYLSCVVHGILAICALVVGETGVISFRTQMMVGAIAALIMFPLGYLMTSPYRFTSKSEALQPAVRATTSDMDVLSDDDMPSEPAQPQKRVSLCPRSTKEPLEVNDDELPVEHSVLPTLPESLVGTATDTLVAEKLHLAGIAFTWKQAMAEVAKRHYVSAAHMFCCARAKKPTGVLQLDEGKRWSMFYATNMLGMTVEGFVSEYLAQQQALLTCGPAQTEAATTATYTTTSGKPKPKQRLTKRRKQQPAKHQGDGAQPAMPDPSDLLPYWVTWLGHAMVAAFLVSAAMLAVFLTQSFDQQQLEGFWVAAVLALVTHALILQPIKVLLATALTTIVHKLAANTQGGSLLGSFISVLRKEIR